MNKGLINRVWSILPKEYKEEVKSIYSAHLKRKTVSSQDGILERLFGRENLEEEESINLSDYLRGCEGEKFFSPGRGGVVLREIKEVSYLEFMLEDGCISTLPATIDTTTGFAYLYPSRESFLAHPLDARKAWEEWAEARKPKRWRAGEGGAYYAVEVSGSILHATEEFTKVDARLHNFGNYFKTEDLAREAASQIRELLTKFHLEHPQE